jgi:hypothetical protein
MSHFAWRTTVVASWLLALGATVAACGGTEGQSAETEGSEASGLTMEKHSGGSKCKSPKLSGEKCSKLFETVCVRPPSSPPVVLECEQFSSGLLWRDTGSICVCK